jgi:hypothetical protein
MNPEEVKDILDYRGCLFYDFKHDLERVGQEAPAGIQERHLKCINQIVDRYHHEKEILGKLRR